MQVEAVKRKRSENRDLSGQVRSIETTKADEKQEAPVKTKKRCEHQSVLDSSHQTIRKG